MKTHGLSLREPTVWLCCLLFAVPAFAAAVSQIETVAELKPLIFQFQPEVVGVQTLEPGSWPEVNISYVCSGAEAIAECLTSLSNQPRESYHVWQDLIDTGDIVVPEAYRTKGKVLVNWTTRVLGEDAPPTDAPCDGTAFCGTLELIYRGGLAYTRLVNVADGNKVLKELTMSIPDGGGEVIDPTHTGTMTLTSDMFPDGKLPAVIRLKVQWANDTALRLTSTKAVYDDSTGMLDQRMHNILVTITRQ